MISSFVSSISAGISVVYRGRSLTVKPFGLKIAASVPEFDFDPKKTTFPGSTFSNCPVITLADAFSHSISGS